MRSLDHRPALVNAVTEPDWRKRMAADLGLTLLDPIDALIPLLDGSRSLGEISGRMLIDGHGLEITSAVVDWLDRRGLIRDAGSGEGWLPDEERRYYAAQVAALARWASPPGWSPFGSLDAPGTAAQRALRDAVAIVVGAGVAATHLVRALAAAGVGHLVMLGGDPPEERPADRPAAAPGGEATLRRELGRLNPFVRLTLIDRVDDWPDAAGENPARLVIYCPDRFDPGDCEALNQVCLDQEIPLIPFRQGLDDVEVGPLIVPRETACYVCYLRRRAAITGEASPPADPGRPRLNFPIGTEWLALEVVKFIAGVVEPITYGRIWRLNILSGLLEVHPVLKLPRCPACGVHKVRPPRTLWEEGP